MFTYPITFNAPSEDPLTMTKMGDFDGTDDYSEVTLSSYSGVTSGVINFWVDRDADAVDRLLSIMKATHEGDNQCYINLRDSTETPTANDWGLEFRIRISATDEIWRVYQPDVTIGGNHQCTLIHNGSDLSFYLDRTLVTSGQTNDKAPSGDDTTWLGDLHTASITRWRLGTTDGGSNWYDGGFHNLSIWDTSTGVTADSLAIDGAPRDLTKHPKYSSNCLHWWICNDTDHSDDSSYFYDQKASSDFAHTGGTTYRAY